MKAIWSSGSLRRSIWVCPRVSPIDTVISCNVFWGVETHTHVLSFPPLSYEKALWLLQVRCTWMVQSFK